MMVSPAIHQSVTGATYMPGDSADYDALAELLRLPRSVTSMAPALSWLKTVVPLMHGLEPLFQKWIDPLKDVSE